MKFRVIATGETTINLVILASELHGIVNELTTARYAILSITQTTDNLS